MKLIDAMTRPDRWQPIQTDGGKFRVGRVMDTSGSIMWARGYTRYPAARRGPVITFTHHDHALVRSCALNRADAEASA